MSESASSLHPSDSSPALQAWAVSAVAVVSPPIERPPAPTFDNPWPLAAVLVLAPFKPASIGRWADRLHVGWLVFAYALTTFTLFAAEAVSDFRVREAVYNLLSGVPGDPRDTGGPWLWEQQIIERFLISRGGGVIGMTASLIVAGWALSVIGARDETYRSAVVRALRRLLLLSVGLIHLWLYVHGVQWLSMLIDQQNPANQPFPTDAALAQTLALEQYLPPNDWLVRAREMVRPLVQFSILGFSLFAVLRCLAAFPATPVPIIERDPMCQECGYVLLGLNLGEPCPECHTVATVALMPDPRQGPPLERRWQVGLAAAFWQSCWMPIYRPRQFAQQIRREPRDSSHWWVLGIAWLCCAMLSYSLYLTMTEPRLSAYSNIHQSTMTGMLMVTTLGLLALCVSLASLAAGHIRVRQGDHLQNAAWQMACYVMPAAAAWYLLWLILLVAVPYQSWIEPIRQVDWTLYGFAVLSPYVIALVGGPVLLGWRVYAGAEMVRFSRV